MGEGGGLERKKKSDNLGEREKMYNTTGKSMELGCNTCNTMVTCTLSMELTV